MLSSFPTRKIGDTDVGPLGYGLMWGAYDDHSKLASIPDDERFAVRPKFLTYQVGPHER